MLISNNEKIIDIADLDCIFLTYDEPKKEEFWIKIQNMVATLIYDPCKL